MLKDVKVTVIAACALMLLWVSLSGHFSFLQLGFGVISSVAVTWLAFHLKVFTYEGSRLALLPRYPSYLLWLIWQIIVSNVVVAKIILSPAMPLKRTIVYTRPRQVGDMAVTIYANSITLTPGTVTVDINNNGLAVHSLAQHFADDINANTMNDRVARLEPEPSAAPDKEPSAAVKKEPSAAPNEEPEP